MPQNPSYVAGENIESSRLLVFGDDPHEVIKATDGSAPFVGVSHEGSREAPIPGITPMAANAGETVRVYGDTEVCEAIAGASITAGELLMSDNAAKAIPATAGNYYVGRALNDASSGEMVRLQVGPGQLNPSG